MSHKLVKALAKNHVVVKNVTGGELSVFYPVLSEQGFPTKERRYIKLAPNQIVDLSAAIPVASLRLSSNLKRLVKARHLAVILD